MNKQQNFGGDGEQALEDNLKGYGKPFSLRLNDQERKSLDDFMDLVDVPNQSSAVKILMELGYTVVHSHLSNPKTAALFKKERARR